MGTTTDVKQLKAKAAEMTAKLSDEALCIAWMATEGKPVTQELALTRGWMLNELNARLGDDLFDEWLVDVDEDGKGVNPITYLERTKGFTPCWTCAQPATHVLTREGSITLHACDNCTRIDRTEAESRGWTITPVTIKESRMVKSEAVTALTIGDRKDVRDSNSNYGVRTESHTRIINGRTYQFARQTWRNGRVELWVKPIGTTRGSRHHILGFAR